MPRVIFCGLFAMFLSACVPYNENIVGRFSLDEAGSCASCVETGPQVMTFREVQGEPPSFRYRFDFEGEEGHAGAYQFVATDSSDVSLVLYPDSAGVFHQDLIGEAMFTQYRLRSGVMRSPCGGLFKQCKWRP
jgi:hypothetical protein